MFTASLGEQLQGLALAGSAVCGRDPGVRAVSPRSAVSARAAAESSPKSSPLAPRLKRVRRGRAGSGPSWGPRRLQQLGPLARPDQACSSLELSCQDDQTAAVAAKQLQTCGLLFGARFQGRERART